jgi:SAM-dependent methyltransferase
LRQEDLKRSSQLHWSSFCPEIDDVDSGLEVWEQRLYDRVLKPGDRILLVGCGTGRDLLALAARGWCVTGLDLDENLVALARSHVARRGLTVPVVCGFFEDTLIAESFDVIAFSGRCYSYVAEASRRVAGLRQLAQGLAPAGRLVITYSETRGRAGRGAWLARQAGRLSGSDWQAVTGDRFARSYLSDGVLKYEHFFMAGEVAYECACAGLRVVQDEWDQGVPYVIAERT